MSLQSPGFRISAVVGTVVLLFVAVWSDSGSEWKDAAQISHRIVSAPREVLPADRCSECHQDICDEFDGAPHGNTLWRAADQHILKRFSGRSFHFDKSKTMVRFLEQDQQLWMTSSRHHEPVPVDWVFGSGSHAMTPVSTLLNPQGQTELIEVGVSWFSSDEMGPTPGSTEGTQTGLLSLGGHLMHHETLECFGCHVTRLPLEEGRIREDDIMTGVTCDRCHPGGEEHIRAVESGTGIGMRKWSDLSPVDSVNRCGECHRRADQLTDAELSRERRILVRFASVGIAVSSCFQLQDQMPMAGPEYRMDCLTCHSPHRKAEKNVNSYTHKCTHCHGTDNGQVSECSFDMTSSDCLKCHMPKVEVSPGLELSDHWIRVRNTDDPEPASVD